MAKNQLVYERLKIRVMFLETSDVITASVITDNKEDTEKDFFTPFSFS